MAKAKTGGSRAYIRGKLGSDVYSIGKDGKGKRQQVVRSLAEIVANPQTLAQMRGRMIMSTVMQAQSKLAMLVDHSFDGVASGQPSISEFIRTNYALIKADVAAHEASGNEFGVNKYQQKGALGGKWQLAKGQAVIPSAVYPTFSAGGFSIDITAASGATKAGQFRAALGIDVGDYFTMVACKSDGNVEFVRIKVTDTLSDETVITNANADDLFEYEGNYAGTIAADISSNVITVSWTLTGTPTSGVLIVSEKDGAAWKHNNAVMKLVGSYAPQTAATALPTYPVGTAKFLNGGEL